MKRDSDVTILFVDDEPDLLSSLRRFLRKEPYQTRFAGGGKEALELLASQSVDIVVSDLRMPEMDGMTLLKSIKSAYPPIIRIILSATRDVEQTIDAINTGEVYRFISKPLEPEPFKRILRDVVDYHLLIVGQQETMSEIEKRLLQASPPKGLACAEMAALMIPAGHLGGDFAEYFVYDDEHVDILVGDVMGKGIQSALVAASIKHQFAKSVAVFDCGMHPRASCPLESKTELLNASRIVSCVHAACIESLMDLGIFASLNFAQLDFASGEMGLVDCGHLPVIHYRSVEKNCTFLKGENIALGMVESEKYETLSVSLGVGDILVFYSDGITETRATSGEMYGMERLSEVVATCHHQPPEELIESIRKDVSAFCSGGPFDDDFTCIAVSIQDRKQKV